MSINITSLPTLKLQTSNGDMNILLGMLLYAARIENKFYFILGTYHKSARVSWFQFLHTIALISIVPLPTASIVSPLAKVIVCFMENCSNFLKTCYYL